MAILNKEKRQDRKDKRYEKKLEKQDLKEQVAGAEESMKNFELDETVRQEKDQFGANAVDLGPLGPDRKAAIDKQIADSVKDDYRKDLESFQQKLPTPNFDNPQGLSDEALRQSVRKQKRAKLSDILTSVGRGLQGKAIDPDSFKSSRIKQEREDSYNQYREAAKAAKSGRDVWEEGYRNQQINYLEGLKADEMSGLKQQKIQAEIDKLKAERNWIKNRPYYKPSTGSSASKAPMYTYKTKEGETVSIPMPGKEREIMQFTTATDNANKIKAEREDLLAEMEGELRAAESTGIFGLGTSKSEYQKQIRDKYAPLLSDVETKLLSAEEEVSSMRKVLEGEISNQNNNTESSNNESTDSKEPYDYPGYPAFDRKKVLDDIWDPKNK